MLTKKINILITGMELKMCEAINPKFKQNEYAQLELLDIIKEKPEVFLIY